MNSYAQRYPLAGRRWSALRTWNSASRAGNGDEWRALVWALLNALALGAWAACPAVEADGARLNQDGLQLAWRPLLKGAPIAPAAIPMAQHFSIEVQLCAGATPSDAALARLDATMPEHRHGMNYRPRITALGEGRFRAEGMMFHMSGRWQLEFEVQSAKGSLRLFDDVRIR